MLEMANPRVLSGADAVAASPGLLGGKAANLAKLTRAGLEVPAWIAVTTALFASLVPPVAEDVARLAGLSKDDAGQLAEIGRRVQAGLRAQRLCAADREALLAAFDAAFGPEARVAVRSSVVGEDSAGSSFAGQMDTYLYVSRGELEARVIDCVASAFSERSLAYRAVRGQLGAPIEAAVVVQRMVDAALAGVMFTADPRTGSVSEAIVTAAFGLGEGVVGGTVEADTYVADLATGALIDRLVADKRTQIVQGDAAGEGTRVAAVPADLSTRPVLSDEDVIALVALGRQIADGFGGPQDIEWAKDASGKTFVLQTRPITTLPAGRVTVFDNANIVENYPGVTLPLTFSFARRAYEAAFIDASRRLGVGDAVIRRHEGLFRNLVALLGGRIYYNIGNWYSVYAFVPGTERLLPAWERALGLDPGAVRPPTEGVSKGTVAIASVAAHAVMQIVGLDGEVGKLIALVQRAQDRVRAVDLARADAHELVELYEDVFRELRGPFGVSLVNDVVVQQALGLLGRLLRAWGVPDAASVQNGLLAGAKGIESVAPVRSVVRLAAMARDNPELVALFDREQDPRALLAEVARRPEWSAFHAAVQEHMAVYGDRTLEELKLESPDVAEDPSFFVATLRRYLASEQDVEAMEVRERDLRDRTERAVLDVIHDRPDRRVVFDLLVEKTRAGVRHRENMRLARSRAFGMVKRILRALDRRLVDVGALDAPGDVFYLTEDELEGLVRGGGVTRDIRVVVALRKKEYAGYRDCPLPPRITTRGIVGVARLSRAREVGPAAAPSNGENVVLSGIGCGSGRVTAPACIVKDPRQAASTAGKILVAPTTDPAWVFLMVAASGLVTERGSLLSHTAIIGRELGVPTVVAVPGATSQIRDGQSVTVDARAGTVELLEG